MSHPPTHLLALTAIWLLAPLHAATFEEQRATVAASLETQSEQAVLDLLTAGIAENRPAPAVALASEWLRRNLPKNPALLLQAALASELSGETKNAVSFHQQALKLADPKSPEAGESIAAVHTLLIYRLDDAAGAYVFAQNEADRLAVNSRFRQFDRWFLDQAKIRNDRAAFAARLLTTIKTGTSQDHLLSLHDADLKWLLDSIRAVRYDQRPDRFTADFTATVKALAAAITADEEYRLLLDWSVSVKAYNMAKIDAKEVAPPLAEAKILLEKFPRYAALVQTDWAGGSNGRHYRDDPKKYWLHETEAKLTPIRAAFTKLTPLEQADLLQTWSTNHYDSGPQVIAPADSAAYVLANKDLVNRRTGPILSFDLSKITPAQAAELAPHLALNPSPEASLIRAFASIGETKDLDKAIAALLGPEAWRLDRLTLDQGIFADRLWHLCGKPGANAKRDQVIGQCKALAATIPAEDPENQFANLLNDFFSPAPKTLALRARLAKLLNESPDLIPAALADARLETQLLVRAAIRADLPNPNGILRTKAIKKRNINPKPVDPHPLEPDLRKALQTTLAQNKLEGWLVTSWVRTLNGNKTPESIQLAESILKSPAFATLPYEARQALRSYAPEKSLNPAQLAIRTSADPALLCAELTALPATADAATATAALTKAITGVIKSPVFLEVQGLESLAAIPNEAFANENLQILLVDLIDKRLTLTPAPKFSERIFQTLTKRNNPAELLRTSGYLWRNVALYHRTYPAMLTFTESSLEANPSVSYALALDGIGSIERHAGGHTWFNKQTDIPRLKSIRGKAAAQLGLIVIPVAPTHPSYPVYQAQAEWMSGNEDSAWKLLDANWEPFTTAHRELSIPFLMWTLQRTIFDRDEARQEFLVKSLMGWAGEAGSPLTPTEKATIEISYGDIALQRGQLPQAHDIYTRASKNPAYAELPIRHQASLRRVRAERIAKNYDAALQTLTDLELERVPEIWTEVRFARAEVYFDREDFDDAKDDVDSILARESNHADSRILLGKIQLKRQKLMEATEVELGSSSSQKNLVPGERLKVTLSDPTLAVSGAGTEIEVVVWATSGDKETFFLRQFGDEKTKFRGEVATALGAPNAGDNTLQVIGNDEVFYAYSERFREKMNNIDEKRGGPILIASDAMLMASARKLLTEAEQRSADMQLVMEEVGAGENSEAAAKAKIAAGEVKLDHERHIATIAKPGNPIHVRVSDPDRSRSAEIDELTISASASSGDSVSRITLKETATHTGIFEGIIPTTGAQASAFAQNSEPGRAPNMVISPNTGYPAWRPVAVKGAVPDFTVDLNDNIPLGELTITAREPAAGLTKFLVQTAMNPTDWTTVGTHPTSKIAIPDPWKPSVTVVNEEPNKAHYGARSVYEIEQARQHMNTGWLVNTPDMAIAKNVTGVSNALPQSIVTDVTWKRGPYPNPSVVVRFQAYFHETQNVTRRFALDLGKIPDLKIPADDKQKAQPAEFLIAVNGKVITTKDQRQLQGEINLKPGIHKIEIWATGWLSNIGFGREVKLRANLIDPEAFVDCPDTYFDPATFPPATLDHRNAPAAVTANADSTEFKVKFADKSRARLIRLVMVGHQGTVPALNKLALTKPDGAKILPVPTDFAELNKNETLEILTGDKISVRYVDDRFITKARERHERFLDVSFTDARAEFADMEPRFDGRANEDRPYYEQLIRFLHNKPLALAIHDADMDSTVTPDKVKVSLETSTGTKEFEATETGDSTGIFKLTVIPVSGAPKNGAEIQVPDGGVITARYMDQENNRPGVPTPRVGTIRHAAYTEPQIRLSHATVTPIEGQGMPSALYHGFDRINKKLAGAPVGEAIRATWQLNQDLLPTSKAPDGGFQAVLGQQLYLEILAPQMALGVTSKIEVFAQTDQGRAAAGNKPEGFDRNVPGSLLLEASLNAFRPGGDSWNGVPLLPSYQVNAISGFGDNPGLDRFFTTVPLILGNLPQYGAMSYQERYDLAKSMRESLDDSESIELSPNGLVVRPGENVYLGFRYTAPDGSEQWATATTKVITHPAFDLLSADRLSSMEAAYVGENINLRVVDPGADLTDGADSVKVLIQAKSGAKHTVELHESGTHTGIFKGSYQLAYAGTTEPPLEGGEPAPYDVRANGFPVTYGDTVAARYTDANGVKTATRMVTISKGADGLVQPFSKKYDDPEIAMRTQFSLAEAYLEVAKRRRKLGENEAADLDYITAKQLLASAMDQFNDPSTRAHAEYLLGSLTMEEAESTEDVDTKETRYRAALSRFINITGSYSETVHAAKAQYQIATIYERLKEPDIAAQEYVKLAYKYPDSEHLAVSMARLGTHFLKKAAEYEAKAKPLLEQAETNKDAAFEGEALNKMAIAEYLKTASIFGRLQQRFPTDPLAGQAGLRAGQSLMRANKHQGAVDAFKRVINEPSYDGVTIRAQAMYWTGMSFQALRQPMAAYSNFKRLTYDFPESEWAAFARGQLSQEGMLDLEDKLELERLESEQ
jgi:outer membrane protein assembly factor BamD (BamD/ComL family)